MHHAPMQKPHAGCKGVRVTICRMYGSQSSHMHQSHTLLLWVLLAAAPAHTDRATLFTGVHALQPVQAVALWCACSPTSADRCSSCPTTKGRLLVCVSNSQHLPPPPPHGLVLPWWRSKQIQVPTRPPLAHALAHGLPSPALPSPSPRPATLTQIRSNMAAAAAGLRGLRIPLAARSHALWCVCTINEVQQPADCGTRGGIRAAGRCLCLPRLRCYPVCGLCRSGAFRGCCGRAATGAFAIAGGGGGAAAEGVLAVRVGKGELCVLHHLCRPRCALTHWTCCGTPCAIWCSGHAVQRTSPVHKPRKHAVWQACLALSQRTRRAAAMRTRRAVAMQTPRRAVTMRNPTPCSGSAYTRHSRHMPCAASTDTP